MEGTPDGEGRREDGTPGGEEEEDKPEKMMGKEGTPDWGKGREIDHIWRRWRRRDNVGDWKRT
jgi:hypothetical protein